MNQKLDQYIKDHSSGEDPVLEELYRQTHIRFVNPNMSTGHLQGKFLEMISKMINPENILEIGTFTGYSSICLARGLRSGGKLTTIELNDELKDFAHNYFVKADVADRIIQMTGNALEIIPSLATMFDLVFIDGDKREYIGYYNLIKKNIRQGGFIIADNVLWGEKVTDSGTADPQARGIIGFNDTVKKDSLVEKIMIPLRDGLTLIRMK